MSADHDRLERQFAAHIQKLIARSINECGYHPYEFIRMVDRHGLIPTCRKVITDRRVHDPPSGFMRMCEEKRLDLTVEKAVLESLWCELFENERDVLLRARQRLVKFKYPGDVSCQCLDKPAKA